MGLPDRIPRSSMLSEADLQYYVSRYKDGGFSRPLSWYRNGDANWKWMCSRPTAKVCPHTQHAGVRREMVLTVCVRVCVC